VPALRLRQKSKFKNPKSKIQRVPATWIRLGSTAGRDARFARPRKPGASPAPIKTRFSFHFELKYYLQCVCRGALPAPVRSLACGSAAGRVPPTCPAEVRRRRKSGEGGHSLSLSPSLPLSPIFPVSRSYPSLKVSQVFRLSPSHASSHQIDRSRVGAISHARAGQ